MKAFYNVVVTQVKPLILLYFIDLCCTVKGYHQYIRGCLVLWGYYKYYGDTIGTTGTLSVLWGYYKYYWETIGTTGILSVLWGYYQCYEDIISTMEG